MIGQRGSGDTSALLDGPPPAMAPRRAGDDTHSLLGKSPDDEETGSGQMTPTAKAVAAVAMFMQAANLAESVAPNSLSPQFLMEIDSLRTSLPAAAQASGQMGNPLAMLAALGPSLANGAGASGPMGAQGGTPGGGGGGNPLAALIGAGTQSPLAMNTGGGDDEGMSSSLPMPPPQQQQANPNGPQRRMPPR
jgi:hypothetical protein